MGMSPRGDIGGGDRGTPWCCVLELLVLLATPGGLVGGRQRLLRICWGKTGSLRLLNGYSLSVCGLGGTLLRLALGEGSRRTGLRLRRLLGPRNGVHRLSDVENTRGE